MQTFLTEFDFHANAKNLDYRRLGKQRVECKQILMALRGDSGGWVNHPATKMWRGYEPALLTYAVAICWEWIERGYKDSLLPYLLDMRMQEKQEKSNYGYGFCDLDPPSPEVRILPAYDAPWWFDPDAPIAHALIMSHRSNLIRKDPDYYGAKWPELDSDLEYVWPVN